MIMSNADIVREYREAKTPMKQISILADLNCCKRKDIVEILLKEGCEVPKFYTKSKDKKEKPEAVATDINVGTKEPETVAEVAETVAEQPENVAEDPDGFRSFEEAQATMKAADAVAMETFEAPEEAATDYIPPIDNSGYIAGEAPEVEAIPPGLAIDPRTIDQGLDALKAVSSIMDSSCALRRGTEGIRSMLDAIGQMWLIYSGCELSEGAKDITVMTITAYVEDIRKHLTTIERNLGAVDKAINAVIAKAGD